jgi:hypothetical protein
MSKRTTQKDPQATERVAQAFQKRQGAGAPTSKMAGEVRFIKDRGGDHNEWAWNPPGASAREIDPDYEFNAKNLEPLAKVLRASLMALGHSQSAYATFTKIKSQRVSPDGNLGGKGYIMPIKDMRKMLMNCCEALSAITDTVYDEINAVHWHPDVTDSGGDPRSREEVKEIMDDVEEIREDPEEWAEGEEESGDSGGGNGMKGDGDSGMPKLAARTIRDQAARLAARYSGRTA